MHQASIFCSILIAASATLHAADSPPLNPANQWAHWRGPLQTGASPNGTPPITWSESTNILWKLPLDGLGHSTPIIWGDKLFLTLAIPYGKQLPHAEGDGHQHADGAHDNLDPAQKQRFIILCINRLTGKPIWQKTLRDEQPHEGTHTTGSWASQSPVTDGQHLIVSFGSRGLYGLDLDGNLLWEKDLGNLYTRHGHGEGSSPALHANTVVVNWDHEQQSFVVALDKRTGKELWKVQRDENTSWSTPLIVKHDGAYQVIISATGRIRSYALDTGDLIWECGGLTRNVVASPVHSDGIVVLSNSYDAQVMIAITLAHAHGDISKNPDAIAWTLDRFTSYVPTPLIYGERIYFIRHLQAFLSCLNVKTGTPLFGPARLTGMNMIFASPIGANNHVYIADRSGLTTVIKHADTFTIVTQNQLDDSFTASPLVIGPTLYLRGAKNLYAIESPSSQGASHTP